MASSLVSDYLNYLHTIKGSSKKTISEYSYDLEFFLLYMVARKKKKLSNKEILNYSDQIDTKSLTIHFLESLTIQDLYSYLSYLDMYKDNQASTRARKIASIRSFFNYYYKQVGLLKENIAEKLETPKIGKKNPVYLTLEECHHLLITIKNYQGQPYVVHRDYTIITLFLNTGMRLSELSSIDINMVKDDFLTVVGKGNKERTIYLNNSCLDVLKNYYTFRPNSNSKALFLSTRKQRMSNRAIQSRVEFYFKLAGFDTNIYSTHKLRHTAATLMYKYGSVDIRTLQDILGHASVSTTQIYTHLDDETLREAVKKNPLSNINL